jgi:hypothetical protein
VRGGQGEGLLRIALTATHGVYGEKRQIMRPRDVRNWTKADYEESAREYMAHPGELRKQIDQLREQAYELESQLEQEKARSEREKQRADEAEREALRLHTLVEQLQSQPSTRKKRKT